MARIRRPTIDIAALKERALLQFEDLDPNDPSSWPPLPRALLLVASTCLVVIALWFVWIGDVASELEQTAAKELVLRADFKSKLTQAANLQFLKKQRDEVEAYVKQLESQLPSSAEMSALLLSINQLGQKRNLQFEVFRPGLVVVKPYYAELPVTVRVVGNFHDFGKFASDVAFLPRIATIGNVSIAAKNDSNMAFDATLKTYRYLDSEEVAAATGKPVVVAKK